MSWLDRMATASFKGVDFLTESHDTKGGRRLVIHEFPGAEQPDVEDLGSKADEFRLNAYFIGADYDLARDKFLAALNQPGADWLAHPWRGQLWVRAHNWSVHESNDKGGYCTVSVDFVPGGMAQAILVDRTDLAAASIRKFADAAQAEFDLLPMQSASMTGMIAAVQGQLNRVRNVIALATLPLTWMNQVRNVIDGIQGDAAALLAIPSAYASALRSFSNLLGDGSAAASNYSDASATSTSSASISSSDASATSIEDTALPHVVGSLVTAALLPVTVGGTGDSPALRTNQQREGMLRAQLLLASAARMALADYRSADDRDSVLASVLSAMDKMLPSMSDPVFQAALDCRANLIDALLAQDLEPTVWRDIVRPLPSTLLAHRMEVDEPVFLVRNKVRHPLFVRGRVYG